MASCHQSKPYCYLSLDKAFSPFTTIQLNDLAKKTAKCILFQDAYLGRAPTTTFKNALIEVESLLPENDLQTHITLILVNIVGHTIELIHTIILVHSNDSVIYIYRPTHDMYQTQCS